MVAAIDDPATGIGIAARLRASPECLAAASELYGLSPAETAAVMRTEAVGMSQAIAAIGHRCDFDDDAVLEAWAGAAIDAGAAIESPGSRSIAGSMRPITSIGGNDIGTADELLAMLPARASTALDVPDLANLLDPARPTPELNLETSKA